MLIMLAWCTGGREITCGIIASPDKDQRGRRADMREVPPIRRRGRQVELGQTGKFGSSPYACVRAKEKLHYAQQPKKKKNHWPADRTG